MGSEKDILIFLFIYWIMNFIGDLVGERFERSRIKVK